MSPAMERKDRSRRRSPDKSDSPATDRHFTRRRSSPRRERSPAHRRSSPSRGSPRRTGSSHRARSPDKERLPERARSPKPVRPRSSAAASRSRSPSPRTKRLRRVQAERGVDKLAEEEHGKDARREGRDEGKHRKYGEDKDVPNGRRSARERDDIGPSGSSMRVHAASPEVHGHKRRHRSRSPNAAKSGGREEATKSRETEETRNVDRDSIAKMKAAEDELANKEKQKPSFELSGKLAEETNRVKGVTLLFNEPPDARKPDIRWRLYVFKGGEVLNEPLYVHRLSCYLFGRERRVADIPTDHPSCSKQHAVLQFRLVEKEQPDDLLSKQVRPYLMDLGSTNGTFINDNRIEPQRYYELFEKDTVRFGNSSREYVLLHEHSNG